MGKLLSGKNATSFFYESGTYGATSGGAQWVGLVQNVSNNDTQNVQRLRYHGNSSRNWAKAVNGVESYGGTVDYYPQDFKFAMFALGSIYDESGTSLGGVYNHHIDELNTCDLNGMTTLPGSPFISFGLETVQGCNTDNNLKRTYKGCMVDNWSISKTDNSIPIMCSFDFIAQSMTPGSDAASTPTEPDKNPYTPSEAVVHFPSGTNMDAKTWNFSVANNIDRDGAYVSNGSSVIKQPTPTQRDYNFNITMDAESSLAMSLYGKWKSGGDINSNAGLLVNAFDGTSGANWIAMSGCIIDTFDAPNPVEGINEWNLTIIPESTNISAADTTELYEY